MTVTYYDLGECRHCGFEWPVIGGVERYGNRRGSRHDITKPAGLRCPFCNSAEVKVKKERG